MVPTGEFCMQNAKLQHWRGFWSKNDLRAAPVLEFWLFSLVEPSLSLGSGRSRRVPMRQRDKPGALDTNRTCDPPLRRGMLYPLSYEGGDSMMNLWRGKFYA